MNISNLFNKASNMIETKKEENRIYQELLSKSLKFENLVDLVTNNNIVNEGRCEEIYELCPNANEGIAIKINNLIPIYETFLKIIYTCERIDNKNYYIIFTNYRIWVMDSTKYLYFNYENIINFDIISKSLMTQVVYFNNIVLGFDTNQNNILELEKIIKDLNYRKEYIINSTKYLCNTLPIYQKLNKIKSGISIDQYNNIVFHNKKDNSIICKYEDIINYELYEDQSAVLKRKSNEYSHSIKTSKQSFTTMTIKVTFKNNTEFIISILEPNTFSNEYSHTSSTYQENYNFAKEIFDKLDSLNPNLYY